MGLGDIIRNLVGKDEEEEPKEFKHPDVTFLEDEDPTAVTHTMPIKVEAPHQQYIFKSANEYLVFNSIDEMPPELRDELQHLNETDEFTHSYSVIVNGVRTNYASLDEIPEDVRQDLGNKI